MKQTRIVLLNTSILTVFGRFEYEHCTIEQARELAQLAAGGMFTQRDELGGVWKLTEDARANSMGPLLSAIGYESTAVLLSTLLDVPVPVNRIVYGQEPNDIAIVFKLRGRPPEGKILTREEIDAIGYDFGTIRVVL